MKTVSTQHIDIYKKKAYILTLTCEENVFENQTALAEQVIPFEIMAVISTHKK